MIALEELDDVLLVRQVSEVRFCLSHTSLEMTNICRILAPY